MMEWEAAAGVHAHTGDNTLERVHCCREIRPTGKRELQ